MFNPLLINKNSELSANRDEVRAQILYEEEKLLVDDAYRYSYRLNNVQLGKLQEIFPHRLVLPVKHSNRHDSSHPLLAILNEYANHDAAQQIKRDNNNKVSNMTIGDSAHKKLNANHNCLLIDNSRECNRVVNNLHADNNYRQYAIGRVNSPYCLQGAQKCRFQAKHCYAVHSVYDITPHQIAEIFCMHNIERMIIYMYMPVGLYHEELMNFEKDFFKLENYGKDHYIFSMGDYSLPYIHSKRNWQMWAKLSTIICRDFNIIRETVRTHGPLHIITLTRVRKFNNNPTPFVVPLTTYIKNVCRVPDFEHARENNFLIKQDRVRHFLVPEHVVTAIISYAARTADESYKFNEVATYASGLRRRIIVGDTEYQSDWLCGDEEYFRVVLSLFIIGAIQRSTRTKSVSEIFKYFKKTGMESSLRLRFTTWFDKLFHSFKESELNAAGDFIFDYSVLYFKDLTFEEVHKIDIGSIDVFQDMLEDSSSDDENTPIVIPNKFLAGHCAMEAVFRALKFNGLFNGNSNNFLMLCRSILIDNKYDLDAITSYICKGIWNSSLSAIIIPCLARHFRINIRIKNNDDIDELNYGDNDHFIINYNDNHYSFVRPGGSIDKFDELVDLILIDSEYNNCIELSAAPGYLSDMIAVNNIDTTVCVYNSDIVYTGSHHMNKINYNNTCDLKAKLAVNNDKYDLVISDAARACNSELIINELFDLGLTILSDGGTIVIKTFGNPHHIWKRSDLFQSIDCFIGKASERYFILRKFNDGESKLNFNVCYERFNLDITSHVLPFDYRKAKFFARQFFDSFPSIWNSCKDRFDNFDKNTKYYTVKALTGYASASKTTRAAELYRDATFVAPTKELSIQHNKLGLRSFTQHIVFEQQGVNTIVIDELSQFPVEYFSLIRAIFPTADIVLVGDVHQTPAINYYGNSKTKTAKDFGIINNLIKVYKIPQDICRFLNEKYNFDMISLSNVENGISVYKEDILKFANTNIKVICFNEKSVAKLKENKINASTITGFTGSRESVVVFYIDSATVASQLINKNEWMYTAMTRAKEELVIAGDSGYIERYYMIHGSNIRTFEEISKIYLCQDIYTVKESFDVTVGGHIAKDTCSNKIAEDILSSIIKPVNVASEVSVLIEPEKFPEVKSGTLSAPLDSLNKIDSVVKGYTLSEKKLVKNQISSSSSQTVQTLIKRYSKKYLVKRNGVDEKFTYSQLCNGLSKAVYNNEHSFAKLKYDMHCDDETLRYHYGEYIRSLQNKFGDNKGLYDIIDEEFTINEVLSFFNKRQSKFDPKVGFDTSDKVGQGVAAMSKKVNLVMAAYARCMIDKVRSVIDRNKRNIILATHDSEADLNDKYVEMISKTNCNNWTCNDFSEWDASFRSPFSMLTKQLLILMGCPKQLANWFYDNRQSWKMVYQSKEGKVSLKGTEKQFSGNPFTICENTIGNMALCFAIFRFKNYSMSLFKGDDSAVLCDSCVMSKDSERILHYTGHGLKLHNSPVGEFAGWFLTKSGMFPDVIRYSAKFLGKIYRDKDHFKEAKQSLQERCSAVKSQHQLNEGAAVCFEYYSSLDPFSSLTYDQVIILFNFIKNSRHIKFSELIECNKPIWHIHSNQ